MRATEDRSLSQLKNTAAGLTVREIDPTDPAALERFLDLTEEYYREDWPEEIGRANWRERYKDHLLARCKSDPKRWLWLLHFNDELVGLANFYIVGASGDRIGSIAEVYVRASARNRKIGTQVFEMAKHEMRKAGATRIKASVQMDELGRVKFWETLGFRIERLHMVLDLDVTGEL